ncbi:uncharacterized protein LOC134755036 [Cydia strobilella]|uniref:uncharacterized protein LOC134755036 n=1 Tax=Cydia strobilella TaxID=1100964 RepID=UPI003004A698
MLVFLMLPDWENEDEEFEEVLNGQNSVPRAMMMRSRYVAGHTRAHGELCPDRGARTGLVILVASAPAHRAARDAIRATCPRSMRRAPTTSRSPSSSASRLRPCATQYSTIE